MTTTPLPREPRKPQEIIDEIIEKSKEGKYIFRGESKNFSTPISSSLYRQLQQLDLWISDAADQYYLAMIAEEGIIDSAKQHFPSNASNIDILTKIQHYGGEIGLIDFTYDLHIALYFACVKNFDEEGKLFLFDSAQFEPVKDILFDGIEKTKDLLIKPSGKTPRVIFQSSVFIHPHKGYLKKTDENKIVTIFSNEKKDLLIHLNKYCNINKNTIYNDIYGFIQHLKNNSAAGIEFYKGQICSNKKDYPKAIEHYSKGIEIDPENPSAYLNRGIAKFALDDKKGAIIDYNKALETHPQFAEAYFNRGNAKFALGDNDGAHQDWLQAKNLTNKQKD